MIPVKFQYQTPATLAEAVAILAADPGATVLAGGQSLIPAMTRGRVAPSVVVDLRRITGLSGITAAGGGLRIGAGTTLGAVAGSAEVRRGWAAFAEAAEAAGDAQVRNRGTLGGALADAHPAGDLIAAAIALGATIQATGPGGERAIPAAAFVTGAYRTSLAQGEIVTAIELPAATGGSAFVKQRHPGSGYALVAAAASVTVGADGAITTASIAITGAGDHPAGLTSVADAIVGRQVADAAGLVAAAVPAAGIAYQADLAASADYRANLASVLVGRAVAQAGSRATAR